MSLISLILVLVVVGVVMWAVNAYIPMDASIKQAAVFAVLAWLLNVFGLFSALQQIKV